MNTLTPILFPHTRISDTDLEKVLAIFGRITICQAWFMDGPFRKTQGDTAPNVSILYPSDDLKPSLNLKALISEYKLWMSQNRDRGYATFLKTFRENALLDDMPWNIRQMIQKFEKTDSVPLREELLKWHLILHLAREFEESQADAENLLHKIRQQESPLQEALGVAAPSDKFFDDLPPSEPSPYMEGHLIEVVLDAWFGLFGEYQADFDPMITLDSQIFDYAAETLEGNPVSMSNSHEETGLPHLSLRQPPRAIKKFPKTIDEIKGNFIMKNLSNRTLVLV